MPESFYTRAGDEGYTGLLGPGRIAKEDPRIEALGAVDEANAALGVARAHALSAEAGSLLLAVQRDLYSLMAELAATPEIAQHFQVINEPKVIWIETQIDSLTQIVEVPHEFIVPGDSAAGAYLDLARTIVRRAERQVAGLFHQSLLANLHLLRYLNRLSSLCFVLELRENQVAGKAKTTLAKPGEGS